MQPRLLTADPAAETGQRRILVQSEPRFYCYDRCSGHLSLQNRDFTYDVIAQPGRNGLALLEAVCLRGYGISSTLLLQIPIYLHGLTAL